MGAVKIEVNEQTFLTIKEKFRTKQMAIRNRDKIGTVGGCLYRDITMDGRQVCCVIGALLSEEDIIKMKRGYPAFNNASIDELKDYEIIETNDICILSRIQGIHDAIMTSYCDTNQEYEELFISRYNEFLYYLKDTQGLDFTAHKLSLED